MEWRVSFYDRHQTSSDTIETGPSGDLKHLQCQNKSRVFVKSSVTTLVNLNRRKSGLVQESRISISLYSRQQKSKIKNDTHYKGINIIDKEFPVIVDNKVLTKKTNAKFRWKGF